VQKVSLEEYLRSPPGHWTGEEGWLHFCTEAPHLVGVVTWGVFGGTPSKPLLECATATLSSLPPHLALLDARRVRSIDAAAFRLASEYVVQRMDQLKKAVVKFAAVRPPGLAGAAAEGFFRMVPSPYPVDTFGERGEALHWLGVDQYAAVVDEIETIAQAGGRDQQLLSDLQRAIEENLVDSTIAETAKRLRTSVRSLQRRLRIEGTSFQRELSIARVRVAQRMMRDTDAPLSRIATDAGFASPAAFSIAFRRQLGLSPTEWRVKQKR
jgi:AraC-like DNA-binding protein